MQVEPFTPKHVHLWVTEPVSFRNNHEKIQRKHKGCFLNNCCFSLAPAVPFWPISQVQTCTEIRRIILW
uniref:Uncharacterized protein n=1 Tax=Xiphophorus maculatus TaxID=8083 RepID=A0A3B5QZQ1_XIPMA